MAGRVPKYSDREVLALFEGVGDPPVRFTSEIAAAMDMSQQGAFKRLQSLHEDGYLEKHKPGQTAVWYLTDAGRERLSN